MYKINNDNLIPLYRKVNGMKEPFNVGRQLLPETYLHNGCIDLVKSKVVEEGMMSGKRIMPFLMKRTDNYDIDNIHDFKKAEHKIIFKSNFLKSQVIGSLSINTQLFILL